MTRRPLDLPGLGWLKVVDFGEPDPMLEKMLLLAKILILVAFLVDILNTVLDGLFISKLYILRAGVNVTTNDNDSQVSFQPMQDLRFVLLFAFWVSSTALAYIFGPILLFVMEKQDPTIYDLQEVDMVAAMRNAYYAYWAMIEVSVFLLEDAAFIYILYLEKDSFDRFDFVIMANIITSIASGVLTTFVLFWTLTLFTVELPREGTPIRLQILTVAPISLFVLITYFTVKCLIRNDCGDTEDPQALWNLLFLASFVLGGLIQLAVIISIPLFTCCPGTAVYWPTKDGLVQQDDIPLAL
jgi:hypothetical protein